MDRAIVRGISTYKINPDEFIGTIEIEEKVNGIYFIWKLKNLSDEFLGMKGYLIFKNTIPSDINARDYALSFAIESIKKYRISRKKVFEVKEYHWEN